ncbi:MAG: hypothetical protein LBP55_06440 [Candidatus Adiutrix sp.]|jgi:hypothetical protein|nr:hypothetical protein [Candidatus Adiutrix sp.]
MAKKSRKNKNSPPRNLSLGERLSGHWRAGKWESFVALYLRNRAASDITQGAPLFADALHNCLTRALFINRDFETVQEFAGLMLAEDGSGSEWEARRDCARVALDFTSMRNGARIEPSPLLVETGLEEPYRTLRARLVSFAKGTNAVKRKRGQDLSPQAELLKKLSAQFKALPRAKTLTPYTTFLKIAETLAQQTAGTPAARTFQTLRSIADLLRDLEKRGKAGGLLREPGELLKHPAFLDLPQSRPHPAILGLWAYFCNRGGTKFGRNWVVAARVLQLKFAPELAPQLAAPFNGLTSTGHGAKQPSLIMTVCGNGEENWSDHERYILANLGLNSLAHQDDSLFKSSTVPQWRKWFTTITEVGRQWRPESPWSKLAQECFEKIVSSGSGEAILQSFNRLEVPFEGLTPLTLARLIAKYPDWAGPVRQALSHRLPLSLKADDTEQLVKEFGEKTPSPAILAGLRELLGPDSYAQLLTAWVEAVVETSAIGVYRGHGSSALTWDNLTGRLLEMIEEGLPQASPVRCFCRLCQGAGRRRLSNEAGHISALLDALAQTPSDHRGFSANLFMMLTAWPQADLALLLKLFTLGLPFWGQIDLWSEVAETVSQVKDVERRKAIARNIVATLKSTPKKQLSPAMREAIKSFDILMKGQKLSKNIGLNLFDDLSDLGDLDDFFKYIMKNMKKRAPKR